MDCLDRGIYINHRRIWPYNADRALKTTAWWTDTLRGIEDGSLDAPAFGVKGRSMLFDLGVDPFTQNALDFMHNAYEGVFDRILKTTFGKNISNVVLFIVGYALVPESMRSCSFELLSFRSMIIQY